MITSVLILLAAAQIDEAEKARIAYSNCMKEELISSLKAKTSDRDYRKAAQSHCLEKKQNYQQAVTKMEIAFDASRAEAEEYAMEEAQAIVDSMTSSYQGYVDTGTQPAPE